MIAVTGGAGFVGSNLVRGLNARGIDELLVVDDPALAAERGNLAGCRITGIIDKDEFRARIRRSDASLRGMRAIFHQGACTDTLERDAAFMMENNYRYSRDLVDYCRAHRVQFVYASSAAVYGVGACFAESPECERPINVYGQSKKAFDDHVRGLRADPSSQIAGLRYFNVYGPGECHKGAMASVALQLDRQIRERGRARLFSGSGGYRDGEQRRDFIHVDDVVAVNLWFLDHPDISGIFNVGTGVSRSFNDVAQAVIAWHGSGTIEYIEFPRKLTDVYQSYTQADIGALRRAGYSAAFVGIEAGISRYLDVLNGGRRVRP